MLGEDFSLSDAEDHVEYDNINRTHIISSRVTDEELAKNDNRFEKSGFSNHGKFPRFTALNAFIFKNNKIQIANEFLGIA